MNKVDLRWTVPKTSQLWLRWKNVKVVSDTSVKLLGAEFFGPVLSDCVPLEKSGFINLDLTKHFIILIPTPYMVKLSWKKVIEQTRESIKFTELLLEDPLGHLQKLSKTDLILLDCTDHRTELEEKGKYLVSYQALVYKDTYVPYEFF